jgi:type VI secretion system protein ImpJ
MKCPDRIQWHEGMLLSPQHFQLESARVDALIAWHTLSSTPYGWGVKRLKFDLSLLPAGVLRVLELEAILPDGTAIMLDPQDTRVPELSLKLDAARDQLALHAQTVWLSLPVSRNMKTPEISARFLSVKSELLEDEVSDAAPADIPRLIPNLSLSVGDAPPPLAIGMAIANVMEDDGMIKLGPALPALLDLQAAPDLLDALRDFSHTLRSKAAFIARQLAGLPSTEQRGERVTLTQRLACLVPAMPALEAQLQSMVVPPYPLYLTLCNLLGPMSLLRPGALPITPPPYVHAQPHLSLLPLLKELQDTLAEISQDYREVAFDWVNGAFELTLRPEWVGKRLVVGLKGGLSAEIEDWMDSALIGPANLIDALREKRVLGYRRARIASAPEMKLHGLPGVILYEIAPGPELMRVDSRLTIGGSGRAASKMRPGSMQLFIQTQGR